MDAAGPIVVGVDPGGRSTSAVLWAAEEAERTGCYLHLLTAYPTELAQTDGGPARDDLAGLARRLTPSELTYEGRIGSTVSVLLDAAAKGSMLVVGRRRYDGAQRRLSGSVSMAVAGHCPVPVIVAPEPWLQPSISTAPLVIGIEAPRPIGAGGEQSPDPAEASLRFAFARADRLRVPLIAVHAVEIAGVDRAAREGIGDCIAAEQAPLETRLRPWRAAYPDVEVMLRCVAGTPRRALTDAARYAQLTVLSRRADDSLPARHLGPTARGFMHQARRPVALVPELPVRSSA